MIGCSFLMLLRAGNANVYKRVWHADGTDKSAAWTVDAEEFETHQQQQQETVGRREIKFDRKTGAF
jgi:hypothetical protein